MFLYRRKNLMFILLINNINKIYSNTILDQSSIILNNLNVPDNNYKSLKNRNEKNHELANSKKIFKIKLKNKGKYSYKPFVDLIECYNDNAKKSVLINKNHQKRALNFLNQLQDADFQNKLKENPDKFLKEYNLTPNEISFILFKLYHPKDHNFDKSIIDAVLQSSSLEFDKNNFAEFQKEFEILLREYQDLENLKNGVKEEQIEQINKKLREKREDLQLTSLMILLDNLSFSVKNATNCFNIWSQSNYDLKSVLGYKALSPAGLAYFLLCILKHSCFFRKNQESSYCLSKKIDETKLAIINDPRFNLGDFMESNSKQSPFSFYKDRFESTFLSIFQNL